MRRSDFHYDLPEALVAQHPAPERSASRLLHLDRAGGALADRRVADLPDLLVPGDLLVLNDTRVIRARLTGRKDTGGRVEVLAERVLDGRTLIGQVRASKAPGTGARIEIDGGACLLVEAREAPGMYRLTLEGGEAVEAMLQRCGRVPLPPYIRRGDPRGEEPADAERYQTIFARTPGAVAAPTAGLHFDRPLFERLAERGVQRAWVTLHVGAGTFQPVRTERVEDHRMHGERYEVPAVTATAIAEARAAGRRVVAVGTTVVRALESAAGEDGTVGGRRGETSIFIHPGYRFRVVDALLTNFHLPESTLLMLVAAFAGRERVLDAYRHAIEAGYRFYSYGDAMLIT